MAAYGTLVAWARAIGHSKAADLLQQTLDEETAADEKLTALAESGINGEAADQVHPDATRKPSKPPAKAPAGKAAKKR